MAEVIEIKKYPNRRLYNTVESRYITLTDVVTQIRAGAQVKIVCAKTKNDLTREILLNALVVRENSVAEKPGTGRVQLPVERLVTMLKAS